jgi:cell division septum initiation protein DivIVA
MRENMPKHEDSREGLKMHLDLVAEKYRQSVQEVTDLKKTVDNLLIKVHNLHERQT